MRNKYLKSWLLHYRDKCISYHRLPLEPFSGLIFLLFRIFSDYFSPEKREKVLNIWTRFSMDCASFRKNVVSSAYEVSRKQCSHISISFISGCFLIKRNKICNTSMKRYAETRSTWRAPLSSLKYRVISPFMTRLLIF